MNTVETIKSVFLDAGTGWVLWMLFGLSVISLAIAVERYLHYRSNADKLYDVAEQLHETLARDDVDQAIALLQQRDTVSSRVAAAGLRLAPRGPKAAEKAMDSRLALEREGLEKRLAYLGTLGNNAPFIGLFGTVIGVIQAFEELGHGAAGHGAADSAAGQVASSAVMSAIAEALVATAVGIAVALPAVAAYNYLQRMVTTLLSSCDVLSNLVLAYLSSTTDAEKK